MRHIKYRDFEDESIKPVDKTLLYDDPYSPVYKFGVNYGGDMNSFHTAGYDEINGYLNTLGEKLGMNTAEVFGKYTVRNGEGLFLTEDGLKALKDNGIITNTPTYSTHYSDGVPYITHWGEGADYARYIAGHVDANNMPIIKNTPTMTYEQWSSMSAEEAADYAAQRRNATYAQAEAARTEAERLAEIERKRAVVDADTLEKQQRATYGQQAEAMGAMGLTGSGYSDYLNSSAYAAGMAARQNANAIAAEAKQNASYAEYMAKLEADKQYATEKEIAEKEAAALKREDEAIARQEAANAKAEEHTKYSNFINSIPEGATAEQIQSLAKIWGITDAETVKNATEYITKYAGGNTALETDIAANLAGGKYTAYAENEIAYNYPNATEEQKKGLRFGYISQYLTQIFGSNEQTQALSADIKAGKYDSEAVDKIKTAYSEYAETAINGFMKDVNGKQKKMSESEAKEVLDEAIASGLLTEEAHEKLVAEFNEDYKKKKDYKDNDTVDIYDSYFSPKDFGVFSGSNKDTSKQSKYIDAVIEMAKTGDLKAGEYVQVNYGAGPTRVYRYDGNGKFTFVEENPSRSVYKYSYKEERVVRIPEGYAWKDDDSFHVK